MTADVLDRPDLAADEERMFVTLTVADQLCGVPVLSVRDILGEQAITRIPLAPAEIAKAVAPLLGALAEDVVFADRKVTANGREFERLQQQLICPL